MVKKLRNLVFALCLVLSSLFATSSLSIQVRATGTGNLLGYEQTYPGGTKTTLVNIDQTSGQTTTIGQPVEFGITGTSQFNADLAAVDAAGHRIFFIAYNINGDFNFNNIVVQDSQTGAILDEIPVNLDLINSGVRLFYDSSTDRLLGYEQTYPGGTKTTLVNIDLTTGATTPLGQPVEFGLTGTTQFDANRSAFDAAGHRIFFIAYNINGNFNFNNIVVQDSQTGAILDEIPVSLDVVNSGVPLIYEASTGRLLGHEQTYSNGTETTLVNIDLITGASTPIGQSLESSITGTTQIDLNRATLDSVGHRIFFIAYNINGDFNFNNIVVQDSQTGAILDEIPVNLDLINSGVRLYYENNSMTSTPTPTNTPTPQPVTVTFNASADTYVRSGQANQNEGNGQFMKIQASGNNRGLVRFDQNAIQSTISGTVLSAKLRLTITDNGNNWGTTGRTVDLHRLITNWAEGNGTENDRGTGNGATWSCAIDSLIENTTKNCSGSSEWEMGQPNNPSVHPWIETATDSKTITNNQNGIVEYDVTSNVQAYLNGTNNYGWIIKKTDEGQAGQVSFGTRESASIPQLIVTYQP